MTLAFTRRMAPETPFLMAAVLSGARRPRHRPGAKDWLRIAYRLAAGLPPRAAALPEGGDETLVPRLLEREEFRAVVAGARDDLAAAPEAHRQRLILLARQAMERALALDDAPVAIFVLEEEARDRDPAATLADGVLEAKARALRPPAGQPAKPRPGRYRWDPLRTMMHRGGGKRLRQGTRPRTPSAMPGPIHPRRRAALAPAAGGGVGERPGAKATMRSARIVALRHGLFA